ncbi:MAG: serine hydrolase [Reichenbachiella sp.]|uniref:serine hydrolase domain-containing protein n=1 Tax=Reichenbachiella sp. TaxID=2184521 RepID=UPI002966E6A9|nr:serine hydrolase [Reichenbachiella sp.]MDW3209656.1 serine hydrolase [Reichenbachiella sp.]
MRQGLLILIVLVGCSGNKSKQATNIVHSEPEIPLLSPTEVGIDTAILNDLTKKIRSQFYPNIHSLLVIKDGSLIYEKYFSGSDQNYGNDIGIVHHTDTTLHDVRSISKSIVSACIGIAIDQKIIKGVDQKIADFFPEIEFNEEKSQWTIEHFLTMTTGLAWNEDVPYNNPENDEIQMTYSENPVTYVLSKLLDDSPGVNFNYNGGATQVLAEIIERSSNTTLDRFVNEHLFLPLGIEKFEWNKYSAYNGADEFAAPSGLRITSRDLLKIGLLYRNKGKWNNEHVLSAEWVNKSFTQKVAFPSDVTEFNDGYGYQFWMWPDIIIGKDIRIVAANGNGDQNIYWDLENDLIVVTTAGNYNKWNIENDTYAIMKNHIYPAIGRIGIN